MAQLISFHFMFTTCKRKWNMPKGFKWGREAWRLHDDKAGRGRGRNSSWTRQATNCLLSVCVGCKRVDEEDEWARDWIWQKVRVKRWELQSGQISELYYFTSWMLQVFSSSYRLQSFRIRDFPNQFQSDVILKFINQVYAWKPSSLKWGKLTEQISSLLWWTLLLFPTLQSLSND